MILGDTAIPPGLLCFPNLISLDLKEPITGPKESSPFLPMVSLLSRASLSSLKLLRLRLADVGWGPDEPSWAPLDVALTQPPWHIVDCIEVCVHGEAAKSAIQEQQMPLVFPLLATRPGVGFTYEP